MRIALVVLVMGCWGTADSPATPPSTTPAAPPAPRPRSTGGATYGGEPTVDSIGVGSGSANVGFGTIGHGSGVGGGGGMRPRGPGPNIKLDPADVGAGGLDPAIVRRYLKRNVMKLQYCYERVLVHKPGLDGTVIATFTIGADGVVTKADANGVDPDIASCMTTVIKGIEFPRGAQAFDVRSPIEVHPT